MSRVGESSEAYPFNLRDIILGIYYAYVLGFPGGSVVKNLPVNAGDVLIPGSGSSPGEGMATHSSILTWEIPWTEEIGGLQSMGSQRVKHN